MKEWPAYKMARDLANGKVFPVSEAVILQTARKHGIGRKMGRAVIFSSEDCHRLYEVLPCPSGSCADRNRLIGHSRQPSAESALKKALEPADKKIAEEIRAKREAELLAESVYGRRATATFAQAALSYLEQGGSTRYVNRIISYFGTTSLTGCNRPWRTGTVSKRIELDPYPSVLRARIGSPQDAAKRGRQGRLAGHGLKTTFLRDATA
jgi:hypothetical protein